MIDVNFILNQFIETVGGGGLKLAIAMATFLLLLIPVNVMAGFVRWIVQRVDNDDAQGFVNIPEHAEQAIVRIARGCLLIGASMVAFRIAGFDTQSAIGAGGIVGVALGFSLKDLITSLVGGIYALSSQWIQDGFHVAAESGSGFIIEMGLFKTILFDPGTGKETILDNSVFWTDKSIQVSGHEMAHIIEVDCNPDNVTAVGRLALEWADGNHYATNSAWVSPPGSKLTGSGVTMVLAMTIPATADATLLENFGGSVAFASKKPLSETIYAAGEKLSVFDIGGTLLMESR